MQLINKNLFRFNQLLNVMTDRIVLIRDQHEIRLMDNNAESNY
jgi:hypothetical protein